jgi:hypothetical protein
LLVVFIFAKRDGGRKARRPAAANAAFKQRRKREERESGL